jgi:hypothetical protein
MMQLELFRPPTIGLCGYAEAGKTQFAKLAKEYDPNVVIVPIAGPLKDKAASFADVDVDQIHREKSNFRQLLQALGMAGRDLIHESFWLDRLEERLSALSPTALPIVDDVRFHNEAQLIKNRGILIHIKRVGQIVGEDRHISENPEALEADFTVINDPDRPEDFIKTMKAFVCGTDPDQTAIRDQLAA